MSDKTTQLYTADCQFCEASMEDGLVEHTCECGETMDKETCEKLEGYCDDRCIQKYCK